MKNFLLITVLSILFLNTKSFSQIYISSSGEMIFSFADVKNSYGLNINGTPIKSEVSSVKNIMRFTFWFHFQHYANYDFNNNIGIMFGLSMRNIGFITEPEAFWFHQPNGKLTYYNEDGTGIAKDNKLNKVKQRTYSLGIPLAFKIGNFEKNFYFFSGAEYEYAFHYKEKIWIDNKKNKYKEWWGNEITQFLPSVFGGVTFASGATIKFKWYLKNFMNKDYQSKIDGTDIKIKPYKNYDVQLFYISLTFTMSKKNKISKLSQNQSQKKVKDIQM